MAAEQPQVQRALLAAIDATTPWPTLSSTVSRRRRPWPDLPNR